MTLAIAAELSEEVDVRFATLFHDVGKGLTPPEKWPSHHGHGLAGVPLVEQLCQRLRVPNAIRDLALLVTEFHDLVHTVERQSPETLIALFDRIDAWRKPHRVEQIALTSEADARGRAGFENNPYPQGDYLRKAFAIVQNVSTREVVAAGYKGIEVREELTRRRIAALEAWRAEP